MRAILVCVNYSDILSVTLPWNIHHFEEMMVVTTGCDEQTIRYVSNMERNVKLHVTDAFFKDGAIFNKFRAMEEGLDAFGRHGLLCILDADILWPQEINHNEYHEGYLYCPRRRMLRDPTLWSPALDWSTLPVHPEYEFPGYSQIFHANDPHLGPPPWHQIQWTHAGGADSFFQAKWPGNRKIRPQFEVLHLGEDGKNWCGRVTPYLDGSVDGLASIRAQKLKHLLSNRNKHPNPFHLEHIEPS